MSEETRRNWHEIYPDLTKDLPGCWGEVTSRAEAQVIRLALIYCLLDGKECIEISHLQAAEALWNYCSESAHWSFMESQFSRNAKKLFAALENGPLTLARISRDVFTGNLPREDIEAALSEIEDRIIIDTHPTPGIAGGEKPMKIWLLFEPKLAVYISERQWHPSQTLKKRPDGRVELRMETTGRKELGRWVLSWMPDVRVLAPRSLRDRITLKLTDGLRRNTENEDGPNQMLHTNREQARDR